jgi:1,4-alpha-glucan branching enzyme
LPTQRRSIRFCYHPDGLPLKRPCVIGSWDSEGRFHDDWTDSGRPLAEMADGSWQVTFELECELDQTFWWGVRDTGEWMLFGESAPSFVPSDPEQAVQLFALGDRHRMGLVPGPDDSFRAGVWAPHASAVELWVEPESPTLKLALAESNGIWTARAESGWAALEGRPYAFSLVTSEGQSVLRADPYARRRQGPQKGVSDLFVRGDGSQTHRYAQDPRGAHLLRFEAVPRGDKLQSPPVLRLFLEGTALDKAALEQRLLSKAPLPEIESWGLDLARADGSIPLARRRDVEAYAACLGSALALQGLRYTIEDDRGGAYHDPWSNLLEGSHNWPRFGIASRPLSGPRRSRRPQQPVGDLAIYELHVGSILGRGGNLRSSTFGEVASCLGRIRELGFTAVALMPTNPSEGHRDWGYLGTSSMAHQEAYANPGESAEESLLAFIKAAHQEGLYVFTDVVYNHVGGDHSDLWDFDGYKNPWFEWVSNPDLAPRVAGGDLPETPRDTANAIPQTAEPTVRNTPWGPIPAFNKRPVHRFFIDHAMDCVGRLGFDGIRFDFTNLIHSQPAGGGSHGWMLLQEINRRLKHFFPEVLTFAEEFPQHPIITTPVSEGGAGFDAMWNTEHQHRLVYSHHMLSVTQAVVLGKPVPLRLMLEHVLHPAGFSRPTCSVTVLSNHDEVGNAIQIASLVAAHPRGGDLARLVCWFSLLCPGYPIIFQGTEDLASNPFTWGIPSSWDGDSHLRHDVELSAERARHLRAFGDVLRFRQARRDLHSEVPIANSYLNEKALVVGFRRAGVWVVANFGDKAFRLPEEIRVSEPALLSSEEKEYGYARRRTTGLKVGSLALKVFPSDQA